MFASLRIAGFRRRVEHPPQQFISAPLILCGQLGLVVFFWSV
jgi:hypothetical protein